MKMKLLLLLAGLILAGGCASTNAPFEPAESDKLTSEEENILTIHARHFLISQNKTLRFNADELEIIEKTTPRIRAVYTARKTGRLSIGWELPSKQAFAVANGPMLTTRDWKISVIRKAEVIYTKKKAGESQVTPLSHKEFEELLKQ